MSGHLAAMSEFLSLGYNVASPEVDRGDDVFVVRDADGILSRIQVKSANARTRQYGHSATVNESVQAEFERDRRFALQVSVPRSSEEDFPSV
jgi:hypothetical protein